MKHFGGWRLCYGSTTTEIDFVEYDWKPISECPLDIRIEAVQHIDKLHEKVAEKAGECVSVVDKASTELRKKLGEM